MVFGVRVCLCVSVRFELHFIVKLTCYLLLRLLRPFPRRRCVSPMQNLYIFVNIYTNFRFLFLSFHLFLFLFYHHDSSFPTLSLSLSLCLFLSKHPNFSSLLSAIALGVSRVLLSPPFRHPLCAARVPDLPVWPPLVG